MSEWPLDVIWLEMMTMALWLLSKMTFCSCWTMNGRWLNVMHDWEHVKNPVFVLLELKVYIVFIVCMESAQNEKYQGQIRVAWEKATFVEKAENR